MMTIDEARTFRLFEEQQRAITFDAHAPLLIVAGAGSGKTTVMVQRMVHLVESGAATPDQILGLTFSNKAAANLRDRTVNELGPGVDVDVSTYHGFGAQIVLERWMQLGFSRVPTLIDRPRSWQLLLSVFDDATIATRRTGRIAVLVADALQLASSCSDHLVDIKTVRADAESLANDKTLFGSVTKAVTGRIDLCEIAELYAEAKRRHSCIDFGDQIALAVRAVTDDPTYAETLRTRRPFVLLDEYQDTNYAQRRLIEAIYVNSGIPSRITAVGDDMQSIYAFRGAHIRNILEFESHVPGATVLPLELNHRSGEAVVDVANHVQRAVSAHREKTLRVAPASDGATPRQATVERFVAADDRAEAEEIARRCREVNGLGVAFGEIAVLCRKRKLIATVVDVLREHEIPVDVVGLGGLLSRPEIVDLVSWLEVVAANSDQPSRVDRWDGPSASVAVLRLLHGPRYRIGMRDLAAIARHARAAAADQLPSGQLRYPPVGALSDRQAGPDAPATLPSGQLRYPPVGALSDRQAGPDAPASSTVASVSVVGDQPSSRLSEGVDATRHTRVADLLRAVDDPAQIAGLSTEAYARLGVFVDHRDRLCREVHRIGTADFVDLTATEVGLFDDVDDVGYENILRFLDLAQRFAPIEASAESLLSVPTGGDASGRRGLLAFLEFLELLKDSEEELSEAVPTDLNAVKVMTIHQAKGLEYDTVFVPGLAGSAAAKSHLFPDHRFANGVTQANALPPWLQADETRLHPKLTKKQDVDAFAARRRDAHRDDELRLLYVALTRAKARLVCSTAHWYPGPSVPQGPSDFYRLLATAEPAIPEAFSQAPATINPDRAAKERRARLGAATETTAGTTTEREFSARQGKVDEPAGTNARDPRGSSGGRRSKSRSAQSTGQSSFLDLGTAENLPVHRPVDAGSDLPTTLAATSLALHRRCPRRFYWTVIEPLPRRVAPAAMLGTRVHAWIEQRASGQLGFDFAMTSTVDESSPAPMPSGPDLQPSEQDSEWADESEDRDDIDLALVAAESEGEVVETTNPFDRLTSAFSASPFATRSAARVEASFIWRHRFEEHSVTLRGRIDAIYRAIDSNGKDVVEIVDFKTGRAPSAVDEVTQHQLGIYALVAHHLWGHEPTQIRTVACYLGAETAELRATNWTAEQLGVMEAEVASQLRAIAARRFAPIPGTYCRSCDFANFCDATSTTT